MALETCRQPHPQQQEVPSHHQQSLHLVRWSYRDNWRLCLQDEKQALHDCVRAALAETQTAAVAERAAGAAGPESDVEAAVNAQIQHRRNQQVLVRC